MTPRVLVRPVLIAALMGLGACGSVESDGGTFEGFAERVANIRVSASEQASASAAPALRPARALDRTEPAPPLRVEVLEVHDFWDAREAGLRGVIQAAAPAVAEAAAPAIVQAAVDRVAPAAVRTVSTASDSARATIQLGAFSSEQAARAAWAAVSKGEAASALAGLSPILQPVQIDGRTLVRLRVAAPVQSAAAICAAARVSDPWCRQNA